MSLKQSKTLYGYRNLLVYKKAEELQIECAKLAQRFPNTETLVKLADQMNRSARSTKQNIAEGWKRNTTREYYQFLGYAVASNAELEEDGNDIIRGIYPELMGIKGIMGDERGDKKGDERGERGNEWGDIEKIPFYPLNPILPPIIRLKLRAKELNFLLDRLQRSLAGKMGGQGTLSTQDKLRRMKEQGKEEEKWYEQMLDAHGLTRLENGRVVKK
ncbi:MAG: four helix bundle protein [Parcubacteria group bacterium]|nr:four helix bundle protein [Parcubacteria group bacterium]